LKATEEAFDFEADTSRILDIFINSLYSHKEIFLRELISNASDALDKVKYKALKDPEFMGEQEKMEIKIEFDKDAKTISITDTGIGMTKGDLIKNLGTIAKSGTTQFLEAMGKTQDMNLIGQFGVGFYSSYLVANKVTVTSKSNNDPIQHIWKSAADGRFSVNEDPRGNTLLRGSKVTLHLKADAIEFCEQDKLTELVRKYSLFINYPIFLYTSKEVTKQIEIEDEDLIGEDDYDEDTEADEILDDDIEVTEDDEEDEDEDEKDNKKTITETIWEWELINDKKAIWLRNKNEVGDEEYYDLYKGITKDTEDPLAYTHFTAEGDVDFKSVLFIPSGKEGDATESYYGKSSSLKLYVRRVLINDEFEDLMPRYLSFVKGVVDSDSFPLNVSREELQQSKLLKVVSKKLVRKALDMMRMMAEEEEEEDEDEEEDYDDEEEEEVEEEDLEVEEETLEGEEGEEESDYENFWKAFGKNIKLGVIEDATNRSKLAKLLRFYTTSSPDQLTSMDEYLARTDSKQDAIYYLPGDSTDAIMKSPLLKKFTKHGIEVLMLNDPIDEFTMQHLSEYKGKKLKSIAKEDGNAFLSGSDEKKRNNIIKDMYKPLTDWWKKHLGKKVEKVAISTRLVDETAYVFTSQYGYSAHMEKVNRAQAFANQQGTADYMLAKKHFELNPHHPIMRELLERVKTTGGSPDTQTTSTMDLLYNVALLNSGFVIDDPTELSETMGEILRSELGLERQGEFDELDIDLEEEYEDEDDEAIEAEIPDDEYADNVGEEVEDEDDHNEDL